MNLLHSLNNGSNHCILKLCTFKFENKIILIAMSTDGFMTSYSISMTDSTDFKRAKILRHREKLHKSGINSYDILKVENDKFLLATGGDDNAINLLLFKLNGSEEKSFIEIISKSCYDHFHSCQVTGIYKNFNQVYILEIIFFIASFLKIILNFNLLRFKVWKKRPILQHRN